MIAVASLDMDQQGPGARRRNFDLLAAEQLLKAELEKQKADDATD